MRNESLQTEYYCELEAPGDFLSGLLGVSEAALLSVKTGFVRNLPAAPGQWRLLASGTGRLRVAWADRSWLLEPGQAAAFSGAEELSLLAAEDCAVQTVCLVGTAADTVLRACRSEGGLFFERGGLAVQRLLRVVSARQHRRVSAKEASELGYQLLMALYGTQSAGPEEGRKLPLVVEAALGIMRREYAFLDGIAELADRLEVSQEYLTRCFCRYIGITPGKYLNQVRIENAKLLLRQGGHTVQFVSDACGFANGNYFARVFRAGVGLNPREYARQQSAVPPAEADPSDSLYVL